MAGMNSDSKPPNGPARLAMIAGPRTLRNLGRMIHHLMVGLLDAPMVITLAAPASADTSNLPSPPIEIIPYPLPRLGRHRARTLEHLADRLARKGVELLHGLDGSAHGLTRKLSERGGWPYFVSLYAPAQCRRIRPVGEHCQGVLAASTSIQEAARAARLMEADRIHLVRPGLHPTGPADCFTHRDRSAAILVAGDLSDRAAGDAVLESFAALQAAERDCVFFILGNHKSEHRLRERARQLKLTHELTFVDRLDRRKLPGFLAAADALVFTRSAGVLEVPILEAMAAGAAVLVGDTCVGDFVIPGETALAYEGTNSADLTDKLTGLLDDPTAAVHMAGKALAHLRAQHSPAAMTTMLTKLYGEHALRGRMLKI